MNDRDHWTCDAMKKYGGSFVKILGELAEHADPENLRKIKHAWPAYWGEYERQGIEKEVEVVKDEVFEALGETSMENEKI